MDSGSGVTVGTGLWDRFGRRRPVPALAVLGVALVAAGFALPAIQTLLFAWGGTALFAAVLAQFVLTTPSVPATVAADVQRSLGGNLRRLVGEGRHRYVPGDEGVTLAVDGTETALEPVGERLLAAVETGETDQSAEAALPVLADVLVNDLELAGTVRSRRTDAGVEVAVSGNRLGADEPFDHPVVSVFGVGLARALDTPVTVVASSDGERFVVTCEW